jgi:membrane-bound serine protease (ClpP class)
MHEGLRTIFLFLLILGLVLPIASQLHAQEGSPETIGQKVVVTSIEGVIGVHTEEYVKLSIQYAKSINAILVLTLNTPGGLLDSALNIVYMIDDSRVPVVGFVIDKWAQSAGTLILVCTHIAAMQPGTIIGSMQPIEYNPVTGTYQPVNDTKIINPILKVLDEHAGVKNRDVSVIKRFVTENLNLGAHEALELGVIDIVAKDINDLLRQLNGRTVTLPYTNKTFVIDTSRSEIIYYQPPFRVRVTGFLSDPIISSLLMTFGLIITLFSLLSGNYHSVPIGLLLLLLGLLGSGFNINYTSLALILVGSTLLIIELVTPGFGVLGITGIIMLVLGIALSPAGGGYSISKEYATKFLYSAYISGGVLGFLAGVAVYKVLKVRRKEPIIWTIVGKKGRALDDIGPNKEGFVIVEGEYWLAVSDEEIKKDEAIIVVAKEGHKLRVRKA